MNYMRTYDDLPALPDCSPDRRLYLNFDKKRAGRALADLHLENVQHVMIVSAKVISRTCDVTLIGDPLQRLFTAWDWAPPELAPHGAEVIGSAAIAAVSVEDDESEDLVQWFAEHQAAAERSIEAGSMTRVDDDLQGEVILARRGGLRSRSWRGGGTMRRH
jgi:hypothetical protein